MNPPVQPVIVYGNPDNIGIDYYWFYGNPNSAYEYAFYPSGGRNYIGSTPNVYTAPSAGMHAVATAMLTGNSVTDAKIMTATENVTRALSEVNSLLSALPSDRGIIWDGKTLTVDEVIHILQNTQFNVGV